MSTPMKCSTPKVRNGKIKAEFKLFSLIKQAASQKLSILDIMEMYTEDSSI